MNENTNDTPVRIGVLSTAHVHASEYVAILKHIDSVDLVGVTDNKERGEEFADTHDTQYRDQNSLLKEIDGGLICSENTTHGQWIRAAADAHVDVLCEKPLATTVDEARSIADYCSERDVSLSIAMPLRHSVPVHQANELLEEDAVGDVQSISGTNRGQMPGRWFTDPKLAGGGAVIDHTVHVVDLVHWLTDERVREVYAETATRLHDIPVEDINILSMELSDGTQFSLDGSWSKPSEWHFWGDLTLKFTGTKGTVSVDCFDETFTETADSSDRGISSEFWGTDPNELMLRQFIETLSNNRPPEVTPEDGIAAIAVIEAAYESVERSAPVSVEYGA